MDKKITYTLVGILVFLLGIIFGVVGLGVYDYVLQPEEEREMDYLMDVIREYSYYYEDDDQLYEGAFRGIIASLEDPYSTYFSQEEYDAFNERIEGNLTGKLGVTLAFNGDDLLITSVMPNSPAEKSGILEGDIITKVDGQDISGLAMDEVSDLIKGQAGTKRQITIIRGTKTNEETLDVTLEEIEGANVSYSLVTEGENKIGYIYISMFNEMTYPDFLVAIEALEQEGIDDLIIDVRGNPGGLFSSVTKLVDYFIDTDKPYAYYQDRDGELYEHQLTEDNRTFDYEIAVLIDEYSASASEIFAVSMKELGGYELIGKTTFGKGTVQITDSLNKEGSRAFKITTDIWLTSNKEWIHHKGVEPTIPIDELNRYAISYIDSDYDVKFDEVNQEVLDLQIILNTLNPDYNVREDGYFDRETQNAVISYQEKIKNQYGVEFTEYGLVDFTTAYYLNKDFIKYLNDTEYDVTYQYAINELTN